MISLDFSFSLYYNLVVSSHLIPTNFLAYSFYLIRTLNITQLGPNSSQFIGIFCLDHLGSPLIRDKMFAGAFVNWQLCILVWLFVDTYLLQNADFSSIA